MRRLLAILGPVAVVLAACSGDGGDASSASTVVSTVAPTIPQPPFAGVPLDDLDEFVADDLTFADSVADVLFVRGDSATANIVTVALDEATTARALVVCEELALFMASHPTVSGVTRIEVTDGDAPRAVNRDVRAGDPGACAEP